MKKLIPFINSALIFLLANQAKAQSATKIVSGFKGVQSIIIQIAMVIGPIAFLLAGFIFYKNKQEGNERFSGALVGTIVIGASSMIFSTIYSLFN